ncbi:import inner membrane translocase subunit tim44 [Neoconidiobolus thromboides FSU 785]|nr:import inner membrane translocase subunit tim44 [Neoconidiobolus thromboides FSU 785]
MYRLVSQGFKLKNRVPLNTAIVRTGRQFTTSHQALINDKSFVGAFINSVKKQIKEDKELNKNVQQIQDTTQQIGDSEALRKAKEAFSKAKSDVSESAATKKIGEALVEVKKYADSVGKSVDEVLKELNESEYVKAYRERMAKVADAINKTTEPIRKTAAYKAVKEEVESFSEDASRYGGFKDKESREIIRQKLHQRIKQQEANAKLVQEDPNAGSNVTLHKDSAWKESWSKFKEDSSLVQGLFKMKKNFDESDNSFVSYTRDIKDAITEKMSGLFAESEQAKAINIIRFTVDPTFTIESFLKDCREYIIPEFLDAYSNGDQLALKQWCSEASFNVLKATFDSQVQQGLVSDAKILDLRRVEVHSIKILEDNDDLPVIIISFDTQEVVLFRNKKSKEIVFGKEDQIESVRYVLVITKTKKEMDNPLTNGYKIMELVRQTM